ncbi:site-specific integrase [Sphingopyxis yananensis]|uniref:site-specific integrase n=1 Tax=Sphingopyxis yananensis TaxID=2886687 RepID=UPI001D100008|nr:site-specific integrase [Sphingopyxis yananensis]MCC2602404.1 tyrosine-type recombinase/integrase [Sphingopyxis yananensis]
MPKAKLDHAFCQAATVEAGKKRTDYYDTIIKGFILECRASGGKSYAFRYRDQYGKQAQTTISDYNAVSNAEARKKAQSLWAETQLGSDPKAEKAERKAIPTYGELAVMHIKHNSTYQKRPENTDRIIKCHLLPKWAKVRVTEMTPQAIGEWLADKRKDGLAPATVEKIRVTLNRSFELAIKWQVAGVTTNPVRAVQKLRFDNKKETFLTPLQAEKLFRACAGSQNRSLEAIAKLLVLTGARKMELLTAKWEHVDQERRQWLIPDSKTAKSRYVPLSQQALGVIDGLPRLTGCPWLLPNPATKLPFTDIKHSWQVARREAGLPKLRIHDLRHSAASFMINAGVNLFAVGKVLGHADYQSTMRYSHLADDTLLAAVEAGAANAMTI